MKPYFSIIIPLYNKESFIENTLNSIFSQTFQDFEVIIVDDGSSDKSAEIIKNFKNSGINYYYKQNGGASTARNFGIQKATASYITFLDADDYWYDNFLQEMFKNINLHPELKVFSAAIEIETSKKIFPASYSIARSKDLEIVNYFTASIKESVLCTSCAVFHKSIFKKLGNFDETIKSGQDTDLWIRIGLVYPIVFSWEILARYVYDAKSLSKNKELNFQKLNFDKYKDLEATNADLKKFLDLNRFSLAIKSKISGNFLLFQKYTQDIDSNNLSFRKKLLLHFPPSVLLLLIEFKTGLTNLGLGSSVFK